MTSRPLFRRRKVLIKPAYQLKIALVLIISFIAYSMVLGFIIFYPLFQELYSAADIEAQARISTTVLYLHARLWPALFVVAILVGLHVVITSHRIFGPIYRFEETLKSFIKGDFSKRIVLRKHDGLKEMEEIINNLGARLDVMRKSENELRNSIRERAGAALSKLDHSNGPEAAEAVKALKSIIHELDLFDGRTTVSDDTSQPDRESAQVGETIKKAAEGSIG